MTRGLASTLALCLGLAACRHGARPPAMADAQRASTGAAADEASKLAPEAFAHAEKLRKDADAAWDAGQPAAAQVLAERATVAYQHALVLARIVRANAQGAAAGADLAAAQVALAATEADLARVTAAAEDLEMRVRVARDAVPLSRSQPADPAREAARMAAARALGADARLLCVAVKMLAKDPPAALADAERALADLDAALAKAPRPAPIDDAARARARCLELLTLARREKTASSSVGTADALLAELSASDTSLAPSRDDRGVFVTLRPSFRGDALAPPDEARVAALGRVAAAHAEFPVQVVLHGAGKRAAARGKAVADALAAAGHLDAAAVRVEDAGDRKPLVDPKLSGDRAKNERVEIVYVWPGG